MANDPYDFGEYSYRRGSKDYGWTGIQKESASSASKKAFEKEFDKHKSALRRMVDSGEMSPGDAYSALNGWVGKFDGTYTGKKAYEGLSDFKTYTDDVVQKADIKASQSKSDGLRDDMLYGYSGREVIDPATGEVKLDEDGNPVTENFDGVMSIMQDIRDVNQEKLDLAKKEDAYRKGLVNDMIDDAVMTEGQKKDMLGQAEGAVTQGFDKVQSMANRNAERKGINPNSGTYADVNKTVGLEHALANAGAKNKTRRYIKDSTDAKKERARMVGLGVTPMQLNMNPGESNLNATGGGLNFATGAGNTARGDFNAIQGQENFNTGMGLREDMFQFQKDNFAEQRIWDLVGDATGAVGSVAGGYASKK